MTAYFAVLEHQPGTLWGLWFPDIPGCVAAGQTGEEAFDNGISALREFAEDPVDGFKMPEPSDLLTLKSLPDVMQAFTESEASLVRIPLLLNENTPVRVNISLDSGMLRAVDMAAKQFGMTRSGFLAAAATEKIARTA